MLGIIGAIAGLGAFICCIIVLIKQFQNAGVVHGIIGIITCGIWTFIWGWMNSGKLNLRNLMLAWTVLWILGFALNIAGGGFNYQFGTPTP